MGNRRDITTARPLSTAREPADPAQPRPCSDTGRTQLALCPRPPSPRSPSSTSPGGPLQAPATTHGKHHADPAPRGAGDTTTDPEHSSSHSPRCPWDLRAMGMPGELWERGPLLFEAPDHCCPEATWNPPRGAGNARKKLQEGPGVPQAAGVERGLLTGPDQWDPWAPGGPRGPSREDWLLQFWGWGPGEIPFRPRPVSNVPIRAALTRSPASISQGLHT